MESFGERLSNTIKESGMSRAEFSRRIGMSRSSITEYCSGKCEPKREVIYKMALVLSVSEAWLIGIPGAMKMRVDSMNKELSELIRIYKLLDVKSRTKLLALAYQLEDGQL